MNSTSSTASTPPGGTCVIQVATTDSRVGEVGEEEPAVRERQRVRSGTAPR